MSRALIVVDVQQDFLPGGALGVPSGDDVIDPIVALADSGDFDVIVASGDHHPANHSSFAEGEPEYTDGSWPAHCVAGTAGATIHPAVLERANMLVRKGTDPQVEAYSAFDGTVTDTLKLGTFSREAGLAEVLRDALVTEVVVVGLALDYCVKATALSAVDEGFDVSVVADATRPVAEDAASAVTGELLAAGVNVE
jgi:nicotinamidase/pyrazinamidase